jgi:hypothetical protein
MDDHILMNYLTITHQVPPTHIQHNGQAVAPAPLISRARAGDTDALAKLAAIGVYPHETAPGDAPLGYTEWALVDGTYVREPAGTPDERAAESVRLAAEAAVAARAAARESKILPMVERLAAEALAPKIRAEGATEAELAELVELAVFPDWAPGNAYVAGAVLTHNAELIEVIQAHTSQADWLPENVPALYKIHRPAGSVAPWVQPLGAHDAYTLGARVTHNGQTWESTVNANVWAPGVYGWTVV